jgi:photosystem II stability/assembly factor-like uncharacterized protein
MTGGASRISSAARWCLGLLLLVGACRPRSAPDPERGAPRASASVAPHAARIYLSTDAGRSWQASDAGFPKRGTVNDFAYLGSIALAGTDAHGLWLSEDRGANWQSCASCLGGQKLNAVAMQPGIWLAGTHQQGVLASDDQGQTWRPRGYGLEQGSVRRLAQHNGEMFAGTNVGLFAIASDETSWRRLTESRQVDGIAFVGTELYVAEVGRVQRSVDNGRNWSVVRDAGTAHNLFANGDALFALLYNEGLQVSRDHGATWRSAQQGLPNDKALYTFQLLRVENRLLAAHWRGVYESDDGEAWRVAGQGLDGAITDLLDLGGGRLLAGAGLLR